MLGSFLDIEGAEVHGRDGALGRLVDVYVREDSWVVRWIVVRLAVLRGGDDVLVPPDAVTLIGSGHLSCSLTRADAAGRPAAESEQPASLRHHAVLQAAIGRALYGEMGTIDPYLAGLMDEDPRDDQSARGQRRRTPLVSLADLRGYVVYGPDGGRIGRIADLLIDGAAWRLGAVVTKARTWPLTERRTLPVERVGAIDWLAREVRLDPERGRALAKIVPFPRLAPRLH